MSESYWLANQTMPKDLSELTKKHGSFRRLAEAYWLGRLTADEECVVENSMHLSDIAAFKPFTAEACDRMHVSDLPAMPDPWERKHILFDRPQTVFEKEYLVDGWEVSRPDRVYIIGDTVELRRHKPFEVAR